MGRDARRALSRGLVSCNVNSAPPPLSPNNETSSGAATDKWAPYDAVYPGDGHTVAGDVRVLRGVGGHGLTPRDVLAYLPPGYDAGESETGAGAGARRYPVLYLQDGQNAFDAATSYAGEWGADEAAEGLAARGLEVILVAVSNAGTARAAEYSPWPIGPRAAKGGPTEADAYLNYLLGAVKPRVDAAFRTSKARAHTGIAGSSLGGLIALYGALARPDAFGFCAALSPALWPGRGGIFGVARERRAPGLRVYLDAGRGEAGGRLVDGARRMRDLLRGQGYDIAYVEDAEGEHNEESWRRRFPAVLAWFLDPRLRPDPTHDGSASQE